MKVSANSIRAGNILVYENDLWVVSKMPEHTKPGKGGAYVQIEMKNLKTGTKINERFISTIYLERASLEQAEYTYLYEENNTLVLMNQENFEQIHVPKDIVSGVTAYLTDNMTVTLESFEEKPINLYLPSTVIVEIEETSPVIKGATATASYKPAILTNGIRVMVPPYLTPGEKIIVKTEDSTFVERAK